MDSGPRATSMTMNRVCRPAASLLMAQYATVMRRRIAVPLSIVSAKAIA